MANLFKAKQIASTKQSLTVNEQLICESSKAVAVFDKLVADLVIVNSKIQAERDVQKETIEALVLSEGQLSAQQSSNEKLINKIHTLFSND